MRPIGLVALLALTLACVVGGTVGIVVGQPSLGTTPPAPPAPAVAPPAYDPPPVTQLPQIINSQPVAPAQPAVMPAAEILPAAASAPAVPMVPAVPAVEAPMAAGQLVEIQPQAVPVATESNLGGRQEPAVSLEWIGPPVAKLGQQVTYQIIVKNISSAPVDKVVVYNELPNGVNLVGTEPRALATGNNLTWELGVLQPSQERRLDMALIPETKGDLSCKASVSFSGSAVSRLRVLEPKLVLDVAAAEKVLLGDVATISLTVSNPGDGIADRVKIKVSLPEGLEHSRGRSFELDLGNLGPNESRSLQLVCVTKQGGEQKCEAVASAEGSLRSQDGATLDITQPGLELEAIGPKVRYLDRPAVYTIKIANPGTATATNITVSDVVPQGFKFIQASDGGRHDFASRTVSWFLGDLTPGQSREVTLQLQAATAGDHKQKVMAIAARGLKAEAECATHVEGLSALLMELVDIEDPIEVGAETAYEVRVTNTGSKTETNLQLICTLPDRLEFRAAQGAAGCAHQIQGREIVFDPLPKLAPRADAIYRIQVKGSAPGDLRFRTRIIADGLTDPVHKEESTKVYGDEALQN